MNKPTAPKLITIRPLWVDTGALGSDNKQLFVWRNNSEGYAELPPWASADSGKDGGHAGNE